jgi:hypothetical protein
VNAFERTRLKRLVDARRRVLVEDEELSGTIRHCLHCDREFEARQQTQRFCTDRHRRNHSSGEWKRRRRQEAHA